jgi:hypothetical protein
MGVLLLLLLLDGRGKWRLNGRVRLLLYLWEKIFNF